MRTSNKLLSGLILTGLLLIAALFIFVRVQVARGATVTRALQKESEHYWANVHKIDGPVRTVSIKGLKNIILVPADKARLEIDKNEVRGVHWKLDNGVLTLMSDTTNKNYDYPNNTHVELFLPAIDSIIADDCEIDVKNTGDTTAAPSYKFSLNRTDVTFKYAGRDEAAKPFTHYGVLVFDARDQSEVKLEGGVRVDKFSARLQASVLHADSDKIRFNERPSVQADDSSVLHISGKNLRQAIITSTE